MRHTCIRRIASMCAIGLAICGSRAHAGEALQKGIVALNRGSVVEAIQLLSQAVSENPRSSRAQFNLGSAYFMYGEYEKALAAFEAAAALDPADARTAANLASVYAMLGRLEQAIERYRALVAANPDDADIHSNLAGVYQAAGRLREAEQAYRKASGIEPQNAGIHVNIGNLYLLMNRTEDARERFQTALGLDSRSAGAAVGMGRIHKERGEKDRARSYFLTALRHDVRAAEAHAELGLMEEQEGQHDQALYRYSQALRVVPGSPRYIKAMASVYMKKNDYESAVNLYKQLVATDRSMENYGELGMALLRAGRHYEAVEAFKTAEERGSLSARFLNGLGQTYLALQRDELARSCFEDVLKNDPENLDARLQIGIVEYRRSNWAQAEKYLRGVLALNAADIDARYYVGMIEVHKERYGEALKFFEQLLSVTRRDARVFYGIGLVHSRTRETNRAIEAFTRAVELDAAMLEARWELGKIYEAVDYKEMAYREFRAILTTDPNHPLRQELVEKMERLRNEGVRDTDVRKF